MKTLFLSLSLTVVQFAVSVASFGAPTPATSVQPPSRDRLDLRGFQVTVAAPKGWSALVQEGTSCVSYYSPDKASVISIRFDQSSAQSGLLLSEQARQLAIGRFHSSSILAEQEWVAGQMNGRIVDFERAQMGAQGQVLQRVLTRLAAAPVPGGMLIIAFTSPVGAFRHHLPVVEDLLRGVRADRKVEMQASR